MMDEQNSNPETNAGRLPASKMKELLEVLDASPSVLIDATITADKEEASRQARLAAEQARQAANQSPDQPPPSTPTEQASSDRSKWLAPGRIGMIIAGVALLGALLVAVLTFVPDMPLWQARVNQSVTKLTLVSNPPSEQGQLKLSPDKTSKITVLAQDKNDDTVPNAEVIVTTKSGIIGEKLPQDETHQLTLKTGENGAASLNYKAATTNDSVTATVGDTQSELRIQVSSPEPLPALTPSPSAPLSPEPTVEPTIPPKPDLTVSVQSDKMEIAPDDVLTFTFKISNIGEVLVKGASIACNLPDWGEKNEGDDFDFSISSSLSELIPASSPISKRLTFRVKGDVEEPVTLTGCQIFFDDGERLPIEESDIPVVKITQEAQEPSIQLKLLDENEQEVGEVLEIGAGQSANIVVQAVDSSGEPYSETLVITWMIDNGAMEPDEGDLVTSDPNESCENAGDTQCSITFSGSSNSVGTSVVTFKADGAEDMRLDLNIKPVAKSEGYFWDHPFALNHFKSDPPPVERDTAWYVVEGMTTFPEGGVWLNVDADTSSLWIPAIAAKVTTIPESLSSEMIVKSGGDVSDSGLFSLDLAVNSFIVFSECSRNNGVTEGTELIVKLPEHENVQVIDSDLYATDGCAEVRVTFWIPASAVDANGEITASTTDIKACWPADDGSEPGEEACESSPDLKSSLINPSMISDSENENWKQITITGWIRKQQIDTGT